MGYATENIIRIMCDKINSLFCASLNIDEETNNLQLLNGKGEVISEIER